MSDKPNVSVKEGVPANKQRKIASNFNLTSISPELKKEEIQIQEENQLQLKIAKTFEKIGRYFTIGGVLLILGGIVWFYFKPKDIPQTKNAFENIANSDLINTV